MVPFILIRHCWFTGSVKHTGATRVEWGGGGGGVEQIQLRKEYREKGDLQAAVIWYKNFHFI